MINFLSSLRFVTLFLMAMFLSPQLLAQEYSAGYEVLRIVDETRERPIHFDIWYPVMLQQEQVHSCGIGVGRVIVGGALTGDQLPVVLLSHGAMGAASNYSWIAVVGASHFGESPVFGADSIDPSSVSRFGARTQDLNYALGFLLEQSSYASSLDANRLGAIGHSSGGASVLMLAGAQFSPALLGTYCASGDGVSDKGCQYPVGEESDTERTPVPSSRRIQALVALDPAVGPAFVETTLQELDVRTLVIGSVQNDFLPYTFHAGHPQSSASPDPAHNINSGPTNRAGYLSLSHSERRIHEYWR